LLAICGHNGSGKTTLLKCIEAALLGSADSLLLNLVKPETTIELDFAFQGQRYTGHYPPGDQQKTPELSNHISFLEPTNDAPTLLKQLKETADLSEIVETEESRTLDPAIYEYVIGKIYDSVHVSEIDIGASQNPLPYFSLTSYGYHYNSEEMGLGEFSVFYMIWRLSMAAEGSIVLAEEPEAFISPRSQAALADVFARYVVERRLFLVITSHSPYFLDRLPKEALHVLSRRPDGYCQATQATKANEHLAVLGVVEQPKGMIFVEDLTAKLLLEAILRRYTPSFLSKISIVRCGGHTGVVSALHAIPAEGHPLTFVGVLDGDQQNGEHAENSKILFLPGNEDPDVNLVRTARMSLDSCADKLAIPRDSLSTHIGNLAGVEPHDFSPELARLIALPVQQVIRSLCTTWLEQAEFDEDAQELSTSLAEIFL
jgi:ABC-type cobalamin/Fe3+-siderophores transport system ATPase subunit